MNPMVLPLTRREWMKRSALGGAAARGGVPAPAPRAADLKTYFGDLHNHNLIGYAQGSLRRTFEIARNHLDFFALTPHAHWHDIGRYENAIENKWINGFAVTRARWPEVVHMAREFDQPGRFVPILGYECHSSSLGDYHILFPDLEAELKIFDDLKELQAFARRRGCLMIPHHPACRQGHRGANFAARDPRVSPLLEIFSEWGNAEHDRAPFPYVRHTEPGRWTRNTWQYLLSQGHRVGAIASSDDHLGCPGAYREGLAAVKAAELSRAALFEALWRRRCYAVTGDRIELDFTLNGRWMGEELPYARNRLIRIAVSGWDQVDRIELLKNNRVIHREFPMDRVPSAQSWEQPVLVRFEYGWGPWPALGITRVCDWDVTLSLEGGQLLAFQPCFQSGPLEESRRDRVLEAGPAGLRLRSFTALRERIDDISTKAVVLKIRGRPDTRLTLRLESPARVSLTQTLGQLAESSEMLFTGDFPKESGMLHRLVFQDNYAAACSLTDEDGGESVNWYYVRVVQANGQMAWSSPIWVERQAPA